MELNRPCSRAPRPRLGPGLAQRRSSDGAGRRPTSQRPSGAAPGRRLGWAVGARAAGWAGAAHAPPPRGPGNQCHPRACHQEQRRGGAAGLDFVVLGGVSGRDAVEGAGADHHGDDPSQYPRPSPAVPYAFRYCVAVRALRGRQQGVGEEVGETGTADVADPEPAPRLRGGLGSAFVSELAIHHPGAELGLDGDLGDRRPTGEVGRHSGCRRSVETGTCTWADHNPNTLSLLWMAANLRRTARARARASAAWAVRRAWAACTAPASLRALPASSDSAAR